MRVKYAFRHFVGDESNDSFISPTLAAKFNFTGTKTEGRDKNIPPLDTMEK